MKKPDARQRLIYAAFELFATKGYAATTTKELAQTASVNEVTLFRIFKSKEKLFYEMIDYYTDIEYLSKQFTLEATGDFRKDLKSLLQVILKPIAFRNKLIKIIVSHAPSDPMIQKKLNDFPKILVSFISEYLQQIYPDRSDKNIDYEMASLVLLSYFFRYSLASSFIGKDPFKANSKKNIERFLDFFIYGFFQEEKTN